MSVFVARDRGWHLRKFGSMDAYRVMENFMKRDAEKLKVAIVKRTEGRRRTWLAKQEGSCQS